jgi:hypothetical protein
MPSNIEIKAKVEKIDRLRSQTMNIAPEPAQHFSRWLAAPDEFAVLLDFNRKSSDQIENLFAQQSKPP